MKLRLASQSDVKEIKALLTSTWLDTYTFIPKDILDLIFSSWHDIRKLETELISKDIITSLVFDDSILVGLITLKRFDDNLYFLARLYISSDYQRKGIGKMLLADFIENHKPNKIYLHVEEQNQKAMDFYLKQGFHKIKETSESVFGYELKTILMEKY